MANITENIIVEGLNDIGRLRSQTTSITTSLSTYNIPSNGTRILFVDGTTAGQIIRLPNATTLQVGHELMIANTSTQVITIQHSDGSSPFVVYKNNRCLVYLKDNSTAAGIWVREITSNASLQGVAPVLAAYGGNAITGRYLEIFPAIDTLSGPFIIPTAATIVGLSIGAVANSTGTVSLYKTTDLVNPIQSISLSNSKTNVLTGLNVALNALDQIAVKVSSGTVQKPYVAIYITGA